jgi:hypothetical protein
MPSHKPIFQKPVDKNQPLGWAEQA